MIKIYINIAMIGSVNQVLWSLLTKIEESGLYDKANKIYLIFNGDRKFLKFNLGEKYFIIDANPDAKKCEFPTLDFIWKECYKSNVEFDILYLHTKGVTKPGVQNVIDWTDYLSYFNISRYQDRIVDLESNDTSGVNLSGDANDIFEDPILWGHGKAPLHYSGNFWWAKSNHIKKLPNPLEWIPDYDFLKWRVMAEMWVCQIPGGKYFNAYSSNVNHYMKPFPKHLYTY